MSSSSSFPARGDFNALNLPEWDREMIESAFNAVTSVPGGWDFLSTYEPGDGGFMFSTPPPKMEEINNAVSKAYGGHSGASYGMTMRNIEFIAKKGWNAYAFEIITKRGPRPSPSVQEQLQQTRNLVSASNKKIEELLGQVKALETENAALRAARPSVMEQAATVDRFINSLPKDPKDTNLTTFANAIQNDPGMRAQIPDIDNQADALRRFAEGKMSYAEMRSLCG